MRGHSRKKEDDIRYDDVQMGQMTWDLNNHEKDSTIVHLDQSPGSPGVGQCGQKTEHRGCCVGGRLPVDVRYSTEKNTAEKLQGCCCNSEWVDFTESTSLHGLRYIWQRQSFWTRRLIWLILTSACLAIMLYQVLDRVIYYHSWPVTVNVKINFNDSLSFPTVTICNQNAFRASAAEAIGRYSLITDMYEDAMAFTAADLVKYNASNLTLEELYGQTAHRKEDLIVRCEWRRQKCGAHNFTEVATDHGKCFTFNYAGKRDMFVNTPGSEDGLSLTLNIEQYEYMPGPHEAAGVKVLLHHPHQFPQVQGLGMVLPAGAHAFIGAKVLGVKNLPHPHGQCSSPALRHFDHYSAESCDVDCRTQLLKKTCGCRLHYMPDHATPVCTLQQYYECYKPNINEIRRLAKAKCDCPVPCEFTVFDSSVSYASTSPLTAERYVAHANRSALKAQYDAARDVTHRLQKERRETLKTLIEDLEQQLIAVQAMLVTYIQERLQNQSEAVKWVTKDLKKSYRRIMYLCHYQRFIVDKDFIRARDAMNERTLSVVTMAFQEFSYRVESAITDLANDTDMSREVRSMVYTELTRLLDARLDITMRAKQNYTQFHEGLVKGEPIFNYKYKREPRIQSRLIVPVPMFHKAMNYTRTINKRVVFMGKNLDQLMKEIEILKSIATSAFETRTLNATELHWEIVMFLYWCREYSQSKDQFMFDVPEIIHDMMMRREQKVQHLWTRFSAVYDDSQLQVDNLLDRLHLMKYGMLESLTTGLDMAKQFLLTGHPSKKLVAAQFLREDVRETQTSLKNFFSEVRSRGQALFDNWLELEKSCGEIWTMALDDVDLQPYYEAKNLTTFLVNSEEKVQEISDEFGGYRNDLDIRHLVSRVEAEFIKALAAMLAEMQAFKDTEEINNIFMHDNILRMNIFYRELNYEQITQQEAYDVFALLCDIGGSMGLFVGASVITIFELFDLFLFSYIRNFFVMNRSR